jgi:hypothetical protein
MARAIQERIALPRQRTPLANIKLAGAKRPVCAAERTPAAIQARFHRSVRSLWSLVRVARIRRVARCHLYLYLCLRLTQEKS